MTKFYGFGPLGGTHAPEAAPEATVQAPSGESLVALTGSLQSPLAYRSTAANYRTQIDVAAGTEFRLGLGAVPGDSPAPWRFEGGTRQPLTGLGLGAEAAGSFNAGSADALGRAIAGRAQSAISVEGPRVKAQFDLAVSKPVSVMAQAFSPSRSKFGPSPDSTSWQSWLNAGLRQQVAESLTLVSSVERISVNGAGDVSLGSQFAVGLFGKAGQALAGAGSLALSTFGLTTEVQQLIGQSVQWVAGKTGVQRQGEALQALADHSVSGAVARLVQRWLPKRGDASAASAPALVTEKGAAAFRTASLEAASARMEAMEAGEEFLALRLNRPDRLVPPLDVALDAEQVVRLGLGQNAATAKIGLDETRSALRLAASGAIQVLPLHKKSPALGVGLELSATSKALPRRSPVDGVFEAAAGSLMGALLGFAEYAGEELLAGNAEHPLAASNIAKLLGSGPVAAAEARLHLETLPGAGPGDVRVSFRADATRRTNLLFTVERDGVLPVRFIEGGPRSAKPAQLPRRNRAWPIRCAASIGVLLAQAKLAVALLGALLMGIGRALYAQVVRERPAAEAEAAELRMEVALKPKAFGLFAEEMPLGRLLHLRVRGIDLAGADAMELRGEVRLLGVKIALPKALADQPIGRTLGYDVYAPRT